MLVPVLSLMFLAGLWMFAWGLRGKRIDDHPWCRKCRFDLHGTTDHRTGDCPECGANLAPPKAICRGQRRKRKYAILLGLTGLLLSSAGGGALIYADAADINLQHYKPHWLLVHEANLSPDTDASNFALNELERRYTQGQLSADQIDGLIEQALIHLSDMDRPWQQQWGGLIEQARIDSVITDDQWRRYAEALIDSAFYMDHRRSIVIGSGEVHILFTQNMRRGASGWFYFAASITPQPNLRIGDTPIKRMHASAMHPSRHGNTKKYRTTLRLGDTWQDIKPGKHVIACSIDVELMEYDPPVFRQPVSITRRTVELASTATFLPRGQSSVKVIREPAIRQAVRDDIQLERARIVQWSFQKGTDHFQFEADFKLTPDTYPLASPPRDASIHEHEVPVQPIDFAFDLYVRHGGFERNAGVITVGNNQTETALIRLNLFDFNEHGNRVDVVFRPRPKLAESTLDCVEVWGEEIVFEDVLNQASTP